ncbi:hypothetical protein LTR53_009924 [Teratosphaeriaceae sp. CCFEE 6253]|nr:hypothetical protein LTR53_009924 [Teratosphaeriaceae sp. CCFEE 6253]
MASAKEKPAPQKASHEKRNAAKQAPLKASHLSTQYVVDSDDENAPSVDKKAQKAAKRPNLLPKAKGPPVNPATASRTKQDAIRSIKKTGSAAKGSQSGSEDDKSSEGEDSGSDSSKELAAQTSANGAPAKTSGMKRTTSEASSRSAESDSDREGEEDQAEPAAKRPKRDAAASRPPTFTGIGAGTSQDAISGPLSAKPYQAPTGYTPLDLSALSPSKSFARSPLEDKQIWHIIAPSDVPLATFKSVTFEAILRSGKPVLTHKGSDYALHEAEVGSDNTAVFAPSRDGFTPLQQRVERTFHLQQHVVLPNLSNRQASGVTGSKAAAEVAQAPVSSVRPQPHGLRMRYRPPGYGSGEPGTIGSDSDSVEQHDGDRAPTNLRFPRALGAHGPSEQRASSTHKTVSAAKTKKKRKEKPGDVAVGNPNSPDRAHEARAVAGSSSQAGLTSSATAMPAMDAMAAGNEDGDVKMTDAAVPPKPSKEDKARRKEEKKLRKGAKMEGRAL